MPTEGYSTSPVVSFSRGGKVIELGRTGSEPILHLHGTTGLGLPPVQVSASDRIGGDGAMNRGVRYDQRKIFVPIHISSRSKQETDSIRRTLYENLSPHRGEVEVQVYDPNTGLKKSISGLLTDGLTGDFGGEFFGSWQNLGLEFTCSNPWWEGEEVQLTVRVNSSEKPFISNTVPFFPVILSRSSVDGSIELDVSGEEKIYPVWEVTGPGEDLVISNESQSFKIRGSLLEGETVKIDMGTGRISPDIWDRVTMDSTIFGLDPGKNRLKITMVNSGTDTVVRGYYRERFSYAI